MGLIPRKRQRTILSVHEVVSEKPENQVHDSCFLASAVPDYPPLVEIFKTNLMDGSSSEALGVSKNLTKPHIEPSENGRRRGGGKERR